LLYCFLALYFHILGGFMVAAAAAAAAPLAACSAVSAVVSQRSPWKLNH